MQWNRSDLEQYIEAMEYVDTLLIPLIPITLNLDKDGNKLAFQGELTRIFTNEIEKYYTGRVLLFPPYHYLIDAGYEKEATRLNEWVAHAMNKPFKHVFFLTFDHLWKRHEQSLAGHLLWFPTMSSGNLNSKETQSIMKEQINQIKELIKSYW